MTGNGDGREVLWMGAAPGGEESLSRGKVGPEGCG